MRDPTRVLHLIILAGSLLTVACGSRTPTPQPAATSEVKPAEPAAHQHESMPALPATAGPGYTVADVRFMQNMIGHHIQAIVMAAMAPENGGSGNLVKLAQKIEISQRDEIAFMKRWLSERAQAVPNDAHAQMMMMPGMLTSEQLLQLGEARGRAFDRLFLTFMIRHHEGALQMVAELFKSAGAGQDSEIFRFATDVDADQRDEIFVMEKLLDTIRK